MIEYKNLSSEIKAEETGILSGFASTTMLDSDKDTISTAAFKKTLAGAKGQFSLCWQHDMRTVVGDITLELGRGRIPLKGTLDLSEIRGIPCVPKAFEAYAMMKRAERMTGNKKPGFSIGFRTLKSKPNSGGGRDITEIDLYEVSIVTIPANPGAIGTVKQAVDYNEMFEDFYQWLKEKGHLGGLINSPGGNLEKINRILAGGY